MGCLAARNWGATITVNAARDAFRPRASRFACSGTLAENMLPGTLLSGGEGKSAVVMRTCAGLGHGTHGPADAFAREQHGERQEFVFISA